MSIFKKEYQKIRDCITDHQEEAFEISKIFLESLLKFADKYELERDLFIQHNLFILQDMMNEGTFMRYDLKEESK